MVISALTLSSLKHETIRKGSKTISQYSGIFFFSYPKLNKVTIIKITSHLGEIKGELLLTIHIYNKAKTHKHLRKFGRIGESQKVVRKKS